MVLVFFCAQSKAKTRYEELAQDIKGKYKMGIKK